MLFRLFIHHLAHLKENYNKRIKSIRKGTFEMNLISFDQNRCKCRDWTTKSVVGSLKSNKLSAGL